MGQRTQIFVTAETAATEYRPATRHRVGRHHQWRYGPHMVICAAQVIEHLNALTAGTYYRPSGLEAEGVAAVYGVNRATAEVSGLTLDGDESATDATNCDNNNGTFLVNLTETGYTVGFLIGEEDGGDLETVTGVDGLIAAFNAPEWADRAAGVDLTTEEDERWADTLAEAVATLRAAEEAGHLMDQETATRVASATARGWKTTTVWDNYTSTRPSYTSATGATVTVLPA